VVQIIINVEKTKKEKLKDTLDRAKERARIMQEKMRMYLSIIQIQKKKKRKKGE
jgi:hypothetical protein